MIPVVSRHNTQMVDGDVYIGRPGTFGNPYRIGMEGNRAEVIQKFESYIKQHPEIMMALIAQRPKRLVCWCAPLACHGSVFARLLEQVGYIPDA